MSDAEWQVIEPAVPAAGLEGRQGTGRTQTRSYVPGISQTSSTSSLTTCDLVSQPQFAPPLSIRSAPLRRGVPSEPA